MSKLWEYGIVIAMVSALAGGLYYRGYRAADSAWQAKYATWQKQEADKLNTIQSQNVSLQAQLDKAKNETQTRTVTLTRTVVKYVNKYIPAPGKPVETRAPYYLTRLSVLCWNAALEGNTAACPSGPDAALASPSDLELTSTSFGDAEQNAITNFGQYKDCRDIVNGWQLWYRNAQKTTK